MKNLQNLLNRSRAGLKKIYSKNEIYIFYFFKDTFKETIYNAAPKKRKSLC